MTLVYRHYDQERLDRECNPSLMIANPDAYLVAYAEASRAARQRHPDHLTGSYGSHPLQSLDVFRTSLPKAPVQVFIHGGGWRMLTKDESSFAADGFVPGGVLTVAISYRLLPEVALDDVVQDACAAMRWIHANVAALGGDPDRIFISGHSAGAHLCAMIVAEQGGSLPRNLVKGALLLSGNYDLEPLRLSARNRILGLDHSTARRNSPMHRVPSPGTDVIVSWGAGESGQYKDQGRELAATWRGHGLSCEEIEVPALNHLQVVLELANPDSLLTRRILSQMGTARTVPPP